MRPLPHVSHHALAPSEHLRDVSRVRLSPDRRYLAVAHRGDDDALCVSVQDSRGGEPRTVLSLEEERVVELAWAPRGLAVAVLAAQGPHGVVRWCRTDAPAAASADDAEAFAWSSGGKGLLLARARRGAVTRRAAEGAADVTVSPLEHDAASPTWPRLRLAPDRARFACATHHLAYDVSEIWVSQRSEDGLTTSLLTEIPGAAARVRPLWSPNSASLALRIVHPSLARSALIVVPRLTGEGAVLHRSDVVDPDVEPAWSPDGRRLAFFVGGDGDDEHRSQLISLDLDTRALTPLTELGADVGDLRFVGDRTLLVEGQRAVHFLRG